MGKPTKIFIVLLGIMLLFTVISRSAASFTVAQVRIEQPQARKIEHKVTGDGTVENCWIRQCMPRRIFWWQK